MAAVVEITKVEPQTNRKVLLIVQVRSPAGQADIPVTIDDQGSLAENETAAYRAALILFEEAATTLRLRFG